MACPSQNLSSSLPVIPGSPSASIFMCTTSIFLSTGAAVDWIAPFIFNEKGAVTVVDKIFIRRGCFQGLLTVQMLRPFGTNVFSLISNSMWDILIINLTYQYGNLEVNLNEETLNYLTVVGCTIEYALVITVLIQWVHLRKLFQCNFP